MLLLQSRCNCFRCSARLTRCLASGVGQLRSFSGPQKPLQSKNNGAVVPCFWTTRVPSLVQQAVGLSEEVVTGPANDDNSQSADMDGKTKHASRMSATGAFQTMPIVPTSEEHIASALKRASRIGANSKLKNEAARARNKTARQMDELVKAISTPLSACVKGFPGAERLHPFERALLDLTIGLEMYEKRLARLQTLRQSAVQVGKDYAARAGKAANKKEAEALAEEGFENVAAVYKKGAGAVDSLKDMAKQLRRLPVVDLTLPTVALVGAPNVGKSSLVQVLSSGQPEICDYPFTTRSIKMGHFYVDGRRHQVTDTPGLLNRAEEDRNAMERLTVACMEFLPTSVLFVMDLTGQCGTSPATQWQIRADLKARFPDKAWLDVFTKADLLEEVQAHAQAESSNADQSTPDMPVPEEAPGSMGSLPREGASEDVSKLFISERGSGVSEQEGGGDAEVNYGISGAVHVAPKKFSWNDRGELGCKALDVAVALPEAIWVSSVTESGMDDLKGAMLQMLQQGHRTQL